jgi:HEAT repeat protein
MFTMHRVLLAAAVLLPLSCNKPDKEPDIVVPYEDQVKEALEQGGNEQGQIVRRTYQNVRRYEELRIEGQEQPMAAMRRTIGRSVDDDFEVFKEHALDKDSATLRNWAIACLGFAIEKRVEARKLLLSMLTDETTAPWLLANACQALSVLRDKETDLSAVIPLVSHGDPEVRTSAATAIKEVWFVSQTPRELTPQYYAAIDRLVALLHDDATTRGRRAAVFALSYLRHPAVLEHLLGALEDADAEVQIGALRGIELLGDARAIDPLCEYLDGSPQDGPASFAVRALQQIAVQNGFAQTKSELESLGTSGKAWRKWFRGQRMK